MVVTPLPTLRNARTLGRDWDANEEAWDAERFVIEFWGIAEAHVIRRWRDASTRTVIANLDDLSGVAAESLIQFASKWHAWCERVGKDPTAKALFWSIAKRQIDFSIIKYLDTKSKLDLSLEAMGDSPTADWYRTEIARHRDPSMLHRDIANHINTLKTRHQTYLALHFFEDMSLATIEPLVELKSTGHRTVSKHISDATERVLNYALRQTLDTVPDTFPHERDIGFIPPDRLATWIKDRYGTDLETYLRYVSTQYAADIVYILHILDRAYGHFYRRDVTCGTRAPRRVSQGKSVYCRLPADHFGEHLDRREEHRWAA